MNLELKQLCDQDQQDRTNWEELRNDGLLDKMVDRDRERRQRVKKMIESDLIIDADDYYHAALVFQHGEEPEDYLLANELAKKSMNMGLEKAKWLVAATWDRYLLAKGEHFQKYGTQYWINDDGEEEQRPVDPNTTDAERAEFNVKLN